MVSLPPFIQYSLAYVNLKRASSILFKIREYEKISKFNSIKLNKFLLLFTCDVELTPQWRTTRLRNDEILNLGLRSLIECLDSMNVKGTFYVTGVVAKKEKEVIEMLLEHDGEIGCHGYAHESYGGFWRTNTVEPEILSVKEREKRIKMAIKAIEDSTGVRPVSFVAPFHLIDSKTISIISENGFLVDSSLYNHVYGLFSLPYYLGLSKTDKNNRIFEVPFTVPIHPMRRFFFSYYYPPILDLAFNDVLNAIEESRLIKIVLSYLGWRYTPIFITCHPSDFVDGSSTKPRVNMDRVKALRHFLQFLLSSDAKSSRVSEFITEIRFTLGRELKKVLN